MLDLAHRRRWVKQANNVKAKGGRKLKTRQDQDLLAQPPILGQPFTFFGQNPLQRFEQVELLNLRLQAGIAGHTVVIGKAQDVDAACFGLLQNVEVGD